MPQQSTSLYKKSSDPKPFAGITMSPVGVDDLATGGAIKQRVAAVRSAHDTAVAAGGFRKSSEMSIPDASTGPHSTYQRGKRGGR